jgi:hypothetical protein
MHCAGCARPSRYLSETNLWILLTLRIGCVPWIFAESWFSCAPITVQEAQIRLIFRNYRTENWYYIYIYIYIYIYTHTQRIDIAYICIYIQNWHYIYISLRLQLSFEVLFGILSYASLTKYVYKENNFRPFHCGISVALPRVRWAVQ